MATTPFVDPNTIHVPTTGTTPPATWGTTVRSDLVTVATPPGAIVTRSAAQTITTGTGTAIAFNVSNIRDTDSYHSTVTNNTRITVPTGLGGLYLITAQIGFAANAAGQRSAFVEKNGSTVVLSTNLAPPNAGIETSGYLVGHILMSAGDYIELYVFQNSGGNLNTTTDTFPLMSCIWQGVS